MDYTKTLPLTSSGLVVFGTAISDQWLVGASVAAALVAGLLIRMFFRRHRKAVEE